MANLFNAETKYEKINEIKNYLSTVNFDKSIISAKPKKFYLKLMYLPLKAHSELLCYIMSKFIVFIKSKNIKRFSNLKINR